METSSSLDTPDKSGRGATFFQYWGQLIPFFLSGVLFLSALFSILAPLPLIVLSVMRRDRRGRGLLALSVLTNSALVGLAGGIEVLGFYTCFVTSWVIVFALFLGRRSWSLERYFVSLWGTITGVALLMVLGLAIKSGLNPLEWYHQEVRAFLESFFANVSPEAKEQVMGELTQAEFLTQFEREIPGSFLVMGFSLVFINLLSVLRMNLGGIRDLMGLSSDFFKNWKAPESLLWPTIGVGAMMVLGRGDLAALGANGFKVLMAVYAVQGFAILSFIFDLWKVSGPLRTVGFVLVFLLMSPLVLSLGFFDTWFDFRSKFRQA